MTRAEPLNVNLLVRIVYHELNSKLVCNSDYLWVLMFVL